MDLPSDLGQMISGSPPYVYWPRRSFARGARFVCSIKIFWAARSVGKIRVRTEAVTSVREYYGPEQGGTD